MKNKIKSYTKHPGSFVLLLLVLVAAVLTVGVLVFLVGYILIRGIPYLKPSLFAWTYNSDNVSMLPAMINTLFMTVLALLLSVPFGVGAAIYLVEYAKKGNKLVGLIRVTAETLSGIPSIIYGLFGMLFFVTALKWGYSMMAGAATLAIMVLPVIMRTTEEALLCVPDSFREGSFGLGAGKLRTIFKIVLPSAIPGILSGIILAIGRIVGETGRDSYSAGLYINNVHNFLSVWRKIMNHIKEKVMEGVFLFTAVISIIAVALICVFLFANGFPAMQKIGVWQFLSGKVWKPTNNIFGIFPMILGSIYVTGGALLIGVPVGILMSIFMARFCPEKLYRILKPIVDLLAGIPSIVYGFFGLVVLVPFIREHFKGNGNSILTASILLGIMILPTIIGVSESAIRAVENSYYEGALALGATHERSVFTVIVPAAKSGIMAAVVLGVGRAIGETMAVMMVAGNQARVPSSIFKGVRTLTANIVMEMGYATDLHREALIATGVVLFVFILIINVSFSILKRRTKDN